MSWFELFEQRAKVSKSVAGTDDDPKHCFHAF